MSRLLTDDEICKALALSAFVYTSTNWLAEKVVAKAQRDLTQQDTCRAVGKWLLDKYEEAPHNRRLSVIENCIEALLHREIELP